MLRRRQTSKKPESLFWKLGGLVCFIFATLLLAELIISFGQYTRGAMEHLVLVALTILLYSLSIVGIFGSRFGSLPYTIAACAFFGIVVLEWADIAIAYQEYPDLIGAIFSFALFGVFLYPSYEFIRRSYLVDMSRVLLEKWKTDAVLTSREIGEMLGVILRNGINLPHTYPFLKILGSEKLAPGDVTKLLGTGEYIEEIAPGQFKRVK